MRKGTTHGKDHIQRLWSIAIDTPPTRRRNALGRAQKRAREQLQRHGFNKRLRCTLLDHADKILLRDPLQQRQLLFANVIYYDLLHWQKNVCDYGFDAITGVMTPAMKLECDANTRLLPMFRKSDGTGVRRFKMVSENTYLTTARRLTLTFIRARYTRNVSRVCVIYEYFTSMSKIVINYNQGCESTEDTCDKTSRKGWYFFKTNSEIF